jgi:putative oxidoreductase
LKRQSAVRSGSITGNSLPPVPGLKTVFMKNATLSGSAMKRNGFINFVVAKRTTIVEVISALFILLFVYTAINKFLVLEDLEYVLKDFPLIGSFPQVISWGLPISESIIALLLFIPRTKLLGLYVSLAMMTAFTFYLGYMLVFTPKLPCTCGGMLQKLSWPQHLIFNIFFVFLAIVAIRLYKKQQVTREITETPLVIFT